MLQGVLGVVEVQGAAVVLVPEVEVAVALPVAVLDDDHRLVVGAQAAGEDVAHHLPVGLGDLELLAVEGIDEEVQLPGQLFGEVGADEGGVALQLPGLEYRLPAQAGLDVLEDAEADLIGVEAVAPGGADAAVQGGELDELGIIQVEVPQDAVVPVAGPALVADLGAQLRLKVKALLPHAGDDVGLPLFELGVLEDEAQQVALRRPRRARAAAGGLGGLFEEVVVVGAAAAGRGAGRLLPARPGVDVLGHGEDGVEVLFDSPLPLLVGIAAEATGGLGGALEHLPVGGGEVDVVLEEVRVAEDVGDDELVLQQGVGLEQEGVGRVVVDDEFVDLGEAVVVLGFHRVVGLAVGPVAEAPGQKVGAELVEDGGGHDLKLRGEGIEAELPRLVPDLADSRLQHRQFAVFHGSAPLYRSV